MCLSVSAVPSETVTDLHTSLGKAAASSDAHAFPILGIHIWGYMCVIC